jgi:hypothetical protein
VKTQQPISSESEHRVLEFRPRASARPAGQRANMGGQPSSGQVSDGQPLGGQPLDEQAVGGQIVGGRTFGARSWRGQAQPQDHQAADDLSRYERVRDDERDDFRHRMLANIAAFAFTVALTAVGLWLAVSIADLRRTQDCVLEGRRDCARISSPRF